ncbi:MAG: hypothetical protein RRC07_02260 [Anaerolineae bacterium]|nr:hypothetical protein [Anaerolineae bacterium]
MDEPSYYRIVVCGELTERWSDWFDTFELSLSQEPGGELVTILSGPVTDQVALRGILVALWDLNLTLLSVYRMETGVAQSLEDRDVTA